MSGRWCSVRWPLFLHRHPVIVGAGVTALCAVLVAVALVSSAHDTRPMQTKDGADMFNATVFDEAVVFYRSVCGPVLGLRNGGDAYSVALEDSIGEQEDSRDSTMRGAVLTLAEDAADAVDRLPADAPRVPSVQQTEPVDFTPALEAVRDLLKDQANILREAAVGDAVASEDDSGSIDGDPLGEAVHAASAAAGAVAADLSETAPLPNRRTVDEVAGSPECATLYAESPVDAETVHAPQVELFRAVTAAHAGWQSVIDAYSGVTGVDPAVMFDDMATASEEAAYTLGTWIDGNGGDPVPGDMTAARDAVAVYRGIAGEARTGDAAADPQDWVYREAKLQVRVSRTAAPVNRSTADALASVRDQ